MYQIFVIPGYRYLVWWTHIIKGLHKNDFIMAARSDEIYDQTETLQGLHFWKITVLMPKGFIKTIAHLL